MDNPPTSLRTTQAKGSRIEKGDKDDKSRTHPTHRSTRYKEKYQAMRERFDKVNAANETYVHDLELANAKIRKLQEENDLLLDAMLANPPPSHNAVPNPKHYQPPVSSYLVAPSQGYVQGQGQYQAPLPPPHHQYPLRSEHNDLPPPPPHGHGYSHPSRQHHQHLPHGLNGGREGGNSHHHSNGIADPR